MLYRPFVLPKRKYNSQEVSIAKCFNCDKELDENPSALSLFCSEKCAEQFEQDFNDFVMGLDAEIPDTLLVDTQRINNEK